MGRVYEPSEKHKAPRGFGSLCQKSVSLEHAQRLLESALPDPGAEAEGKLYNVCGEAVFVAQPTRPEADVWHGYPELGSRVPPQALRALVQARLLDRLTYRRLLKQRTLPERCACR